MFEVAWCVILYTTVLALELAPPVLERLRWPRALRAWRLALPVLAFLGTMLSLLHQSSLGAIYLLFPGSLHPLWYSPLLPLHFLLSAVGAGCAVVLLVADLAGRAAGRPFDESLRRSLLLFVGVVLASYGALRVADATWRGALAAASPATLVGASFLAEMLLGVAVPATAAFVPRLRRSRAGALLAAGSAAAGLALNRWNVTVAGLEGTRRAGYVPSWGEIAVAAMIAALAVGVFRTAVRRLPVFVREEAADRERP
jgi:Ni/Fe-hydrogenase subunit HybB-like protein